MAQRVSMINLKKITLGENDLVRSVMQNVRCILRTPKFTVPLYREFGVDTSFIDTPITVVAPIIYAEIREAIETFEPRCEVVDITFEIDPQNPGRLFPAVEVEING